MFTKLLPPSASPLPVIGVLGGAGPLIAARFQWDWLQAHQRRTGAWRDADYPALLSLNQALAGVDETGLADPIAAGKALATQAQTAHQAGATHLIVACASLHAVLDPARAPCPLIDWLAQGAADLRARGLHRIGIVESQSSRRDAVFARALVVAGLEPVALPAPLAVHADALIRQGMAGRLRAPERAHVRTIEAWLAPRCELIWWGCTELSFIPRAWLTHPHLRSLDAMVAACQQALLSPTEMSS